MCAGNPVDGSFDGRSEAVEAHDLQLRRTPSADDVDVARRSLHQAQDRERAAAADDPLNRVGALEREGVVELN